MSAVLILVAVAWTTAARGGTAPRDMAITAVLLGAAAVGGHLPRVRWDVAVSVGLLVGWMVMVALLRGEVSFATLHVPLVVVLAALAALATQALDEEGRTTVLTGVVVLGTVHALIVLASWGADLMSGEPVLPPHVRAESLLGSANALGYVLVGTGVLTLGAAVRAGSARGRRAVMGTALALQVAALLLTGSRGAIIVGVAAAVWLVWRFNWRDLVQSPVRLGASAVAVAGAAVVVGLRSADEGLADRTDLWSQAMQRIGESPVLGHGLAATPYELTDPWDRLTTHAHNEVLQLTVEYGAVGLLLVGAIGALLLVRGRSVRMHGDPVVLAAGAALLAAGLTDFSLRITAVAVLASVVLTIALSPVHAATSEHTDDHEAEADRPSSDPGTTRAPAPSRSGD